MRTRTRPIQLHLPFGRKHIFILLATLMCGCSNQNPSTDAPDGSNAPVSTESSEQPAAETAIATPTPKPTPPDPSNRFMKQGSPSDTHGISVKTLPNGAEEISTVQGGGIAIGGSQMSVAGPGVSNIHILIHPDVGETRYYGLSFKEPCIVSIRKDGTVLLHKTDVNVIGPSGNAWVSREVVLEDEKVIALFPAE